MIIAVVYGETQQKNFNDFIFSFVRGGDRGPAVAAQLRHRNKGWAFILIPGTEHDIRTSSQH